MCASWRRLMRRSRAIVVVGLVSIFLTPWSALAQGGPPPTLGALAPENLKKPRPAAPVDLTGTWFIDLAGGKPWQFGPPYPKLTAAAQAQLDAFKKAEAEGRVYRD